MDSAPHRLAIDGDLTIFTVRERTAQLAQALASHKALQIDLAGLTDFDTAGLQLLLLLQIEASAGGASSELPQSWSGADALPGHAAPA